MSFYCQDGDCDKQCEACGTKRNINFEDIPNDANKHDVTSRTLTTLEKVMLKQDDYGIKKYGVALKHQHRYNWLDMFMEEMADGLKYIQNEVDRKKLIIELLETALEVDNPKFVIKTALELLTIQGTGK
jgi:hypothetical protein